MKRFTRTVSLLLCLSLLTGLLVLPAAATSSFSDVPKGAWYAPYVQYAYENGLMNGTGNGEFSPEATTTRAMVVTILYRISGSPDTDVYQFGDVPQGKWYSDAISWAANNSIVNGTGNGNFSPNNPVTREQLVTMLYRYAQYLTFDTVSYYDCYEDFTDAGSISSWALTACNWAVSEAIVNGVKDDVLAPKGSAIRAQVATIMQRFIDCYNIDLNDPPAPPEPEPQPQPMDAKYSTLYFDDGGSLWLGMTEAELCSAVGQPSEKLTGTFRGTWYLYNTDNYHNFFMALVKEGKVYRLYMAAENMSYLGYRIGDILDADEMDDYAKSIQNQSHSTLSCAFQLDVTADSSLAGISISDLSQLPHDPSQDGFPNENDQAAVDQWIAAYDAYLSGVYNSVKPTTDQLRQESKVCFHVINAWRSHRDISPLTWNDTLAEVARLHSQDMADRNYNSHVDPDGVTPQDRIEATGLNITGSFIGENSCITETNGLDAFNLWLHSKPHRTGMTGFNYAGVGAGYNENSDYGYYWTTDFTMTIN